MVILRDFLGVFEHYTKGTQLLVFTQFWVLLSVSIIRILGDQFQVSQLARFLILSNILPSRYQSDSFSNLHHNFNFCLKLPKLKNQDSFCEIKKRQFDFRFPQIPKND